MSVWQCLITLCNMLRVGAGDQAAFPLGQACVPGPTSQLAAIIGGGQSPKITSAGPQE